MRLYLLLLACLVVVGCGGSTEPVVLRAEDITGTWSIMGSGCGVGTFTATLQANAEDERIDGTYLHPDQHNLVGSWDPHTGKFRIGLSLTERIDGTMTSSGHMAGTFTDEQPSCTTDISGTKTG